MRHNLPLLLFSSIPIMISNIGLAEHSSADCGLVLRRIITFAAYAHRFHIVETLRVFVVFRKVVRSTACS
jgi:hypothetical protein